MSQEGSSGTGKGMLWAGRILSALPVLGLLASATMKLMAKPELIANFSGKYGYPSGALPLIAVAEILCALLYAIPNTAVLGAILIAAYLGGAVSTHVRAGENFAAPIILAVIAWLGLWLRDARVRALTPLRK